MMLENWGHEFINATVPHTWVNNDDHGKKVPGGRIWSQRVNANGKEDLYEALTKAEREYNQERYIQLQIRFAQEARGETWLIARTGDGHLSWEINHDAIFSDPSALDKIRFSAFNDDMHASAGDLEWLEALEKEERDQQRAVLQAVVDTYASKKSPAG